MQQEDVYVWKDSSVAHLLPSGPGILPSVRWKFLQTERLVSLHRQVFRESPTDFWILIKQPSMQHFFQSENIHCDHKSFKSYWSRMGCEGCNSLPGFLFTSLLTCKRGTGKWDTYFPWIETMSSSVSWTAQPLWRKRGLGHKVNIFQGLNIR